MDLNIRSPLVQEFYRRTLSRLAGYGAKIVRLDAFAYAPKEVGARNFLNEPGTWDFLSQLAEMAKPHGVALLPGKRLYGLRLFPARAAAGRL